MVGLRLLQLSKVVLMTLEFFELPLSDESLYLVLQGLTVIGIVFAFPMKSAMLGHVPFSSGAFDLCRIGQYSPRLDLHQDVR